ncbi:response regulator [Undibacterium sp. Dicai25W]|uniref:response regulator n=1 Tax=Undibacterium sp. Dicai25W TaxID=3413034 RepID=UPI003BF42107
MKERIIIVEPQPMVSVALTALLDLKTDLQVIAIKNNGREALNLYQQEMPDTLITDIEMPVMTGLELAATIQEQVLTCKVIMLTTFARTGFLRRATASGVRGYILKDAPAETLSQTIHNVHAGGKTAAPELAIQSWRGSLDPLSERESQVLRSAGTGSSTAEIARLMFLSEGTVRNYLSEAINKLSAKNHAAAYRLARDEGWFRQTR